MLGADAPHHRRYIVEDGVGVPLPQMVLDLPVQASHRPPEQAAVGEVRGYADLPLLCGVVRLVLRELPVLHDVRRLGDQHEHEADDVDHGQEDQQYDAHTQP